MYDKKDENKNLNMFVRNNGKKDHVHVLYPLLYVAKKENNIKLRCLWGKNKNIKLCLDGPAK
jgi:hypothetical protein